MKCKVCEATPESAEFYDCITSYCKEHWRAQVKENRMARLEQYRAYEQSRANLPHRVAARSEYQKSERGRQAHQRATEAYAKRYPERYRARNILNAAVRDGKVTPLPCFMCGEEAQAHHPDYSRPLDVVWLCPEHHKQAHALGRRLMQQESQTPERKTL